MNYRIAGTAGLHPRRTLRLVQLIASKCDSRCDLGCLWALVASWCLCLSVWGCSSTVRTGRAHRADISTSLQEAPLVGTQEVIVRYRSTSEEPITTLVLTLTVPDGPGPFPVILLNHGSPRSAKSRRRKAAYPTATRWFLSRGFAVVIPNRRGYGGSDGPYAEGFGPCEAPNYLRAGKATAADIGVVLQWLATRPWVQRGQVVVAGASAGGWGALAVAGQPFQDVAGVINFAGGRGSPRDGFNCGPDQLVSASRIFGREARVPSLWLYSTNDPYFPPSLAQQMYRAFVSESRPSATFLMLPEFMENGHALLSSERGPSGWSKAVDEFLIGLFRPPESESDTRQ